MSEKNESLIKNQADHGNMLKAFRSSSEVENLYRFIHENGLRAEALKLMKIVLKKTISTRKKTKKKLQ